jgi:hypothetical protein
VLSPVSQSGRLLVEFYSNPKQGYGRSHDRLYLVDLPRRRVILLRRGLHCYKMAISPDERQAAVVSDGFLIWLHLPVSR